MVARRCVFLICAIFSILPNELHAQGGHAIHPRDAKPHRRTYNMMGHFGEALAYNDVQTWQGLKYLIDAGPKLRSSQRSRSERNLRGLQPSYDVKGRGVVNLPNSNVFLQANINRNPTGVNNQRKGGKVSPIFLEFVSWSK
jgi:hypothetical protein